MTGETTMRTELTIWLPDVDRADERLNEIVDLAMKLIPGAFAASETTP